MQPYTVEPLIKDTPNKGHFFRSGARIFNLRIKDTSVYINDNFHGPSVSVIQRFHFPHPPIPPVIEEVNLVVPIIGGVLGALAFTIPIILVI